MRWNARAPAIMLAVLAACLAFWWLEAANVFPSGAFWACSCGNGANVAPGAYSGLPCACQPRAPIGYLPHVLAPMLYIIALPALAASFIFPKLAGLLRKKRKAGKTGKK